MIWCDTSINVTPNFLANIAFEWFKSPDTNASTDLSFANLINSLLLKPNPETMANKLLIA